MRSAKRTFIIAEAGVNHNGSPKRARQLVDIAAKSNVDAVKFQSFSPERLVAVSAQKADYQKKGGPAGETQFQMLKRYCLSQQDQRELKNYCKIRGVQFLSSVFSIEDLKFLASLRLDTIKIPSGEITNLPLLRRAGASGKRIILSTGMSSLREVGDALNVLLSCGTSRSRIALLHCSTQYPAPFEDVNLRAMITLRDRFRVAVGYSDHTHGQEVALAAVTLGARIIEKHFTIDKNLPGPDHASSLDEGELRSLVRAVRNVEASLGSSVKRPSEIEMKNRIAVRKSLVANRSIMKGETFNHKNVTAKRPFVGLSPMAWDKVMGRIAKRDFNEDEAITL